MDPFYESEPNSIAGFVGVRLNGMKTPFSKTGKEVSHHAILKKAFGFDQEETKAIRSANNGRFRNNVTYERRRERTNKHSIYSDSSIGVGGYSSTERLLSLCQSVPTIGTAQLKLTSLPSKWNRKYGMY